MKSTVPSVGSVPLICTTNSFYSKQSFSQLYVPDVNQLPIIANHNGASPCTTKKKTKKILKPHTAFITDSIFYQQFHKDNSTFLAANTTHNP